MSTLKSPRAIALDAVTRTAGELIERMDTVIALDIDDDELQKILTGAINSIGKALGAFNEQRQERDQLPAAGNVERAEVGALALKARAFFAGKTEAPVIAGHFRTDCQELCDRIGDARRTLDSADPLRTSLHDLETTVLQVGKSLVMFR